MVAPIKVAIIGAGPQGLAALKNLLELNASDPATKPLFCATVFDARSRPGGLWSYSEDPDTLSTLRSTLSNVSRWRNCYSDFPVAEAWAADGREGDPPAYLNQEETQMYFDRYVEKFELKGYMKFGCKVRRIRRAGGGGKDEEWEVEVEEVATGDKKLRVFDKVIVATGQVNTPYMPDIPGIEKFKGKVIHSCQFKTAKDFQGLRVIVLGFSNTAADTACELVQYAKRIHLSHRRGNFIFPRIVKNKPLDLQATRRLLTIKFALTSFAPLRGQAFFDNFMAKMTNEAFSGRLKPEWRFQPAPSAVSQNAIISDFLVTYLESGVIESAEAISEILDGQSVQLTNGMILDADAIIFCTGYEGNSTLDAPVEFSGSPSLPRLYQQVFHPRYPTSLAFMTFWETPTGICEIADLMSMAIAQVFAGNYALPSRDHIESHIDKSHIALRALSPLGFDGRHKASRSRAILVNESGWRYFLNDAAGTGVNDFLGWGLLGWSYYFSNRAFCGLLMNGVDTPYIYRLFPTRKGGPSRWALSKKYIELANEEVEKFVLQHKGTIGGI